MTHTDRRHFLKSAAAGAVGASLLPSIAQAALTERKTKRVVLIAFAGGVRTRETFGTPGNVPNMKAMADEGVLYTRARTANLGHFGASMSLFTGISEARGIRENARGIDPTMFEYMRKSLALEQNDVWVTTTGGAQQTNYSHSLHPEFGPKFGATTLDGDGIFNKEFKDILSLYGMPKRMPEQETALLAELRDSLGGSDPKERRNLARVEQYILDELTKGTSGISGANAGDAKALRLARNLMSLFKPKVTGVVLQNADVAHGSFNAYSEVIRRNDAAIGELWTAVKEDPELADSTAFFIVPEFGRDADLNARRGLDHGDGSQDLNYVTVLAWGPDFKRGVVSTDTIRTIDVTPTICGMFGAEAKFARGSRLPGLFA